MGEDWIIAVDLGGTQLRAALCTPGGTITKRVRKKTRAKRGSKAVLERLCKTAEQVWPDKGRVLAIGISVPGALDRSKGVVVEAPNLAGWKNVPVSDAVSGHLHVPVCVGNDANLAALAEHRFGAGQGVDDMIYMTISTGIGGGIIVGGKLLLGHRGLAGEVGHMVMQPDGPLCGCGNRGCLEALASGTAILAAAGGDVAQVSCESVGSAAAQGDNVAVDLLRHAGQTIGIAIANLMHLFNPQRFVLGGGVTRTGELLFKPIRRAARRWAQNPRYVEQTEIVPAALGDDVSLLGALALARSQVGLE